MEKFRENFQPNQYPGQITGGENYGDGRGMRVSLGQSDSIDRGKPSWPLERGRTKSSIWPIKLAPSQQRRRRLPSKKKDGADSP